MKRSVIRLCSAALLMALALSASVAMIGGISAQETAPAEEDTYVWVRLLFASEPRGGPICLFSAEGLPVQQLTPDENGLAASGLLTPGKYYAVTGLGCTEFTLHENASVSADGGCGWSDGEILHLTGAQIGTVTVERAASQALLAQNGGWFDFTLRGDGFERREVLRRTDADGVLSCRFEGIPYGTYILEENGIARCRVTVSAAQDDVTVALP